MHADPNDAPAGEPAHRRIHGEPGIDEMPPLELVFTARDETDMDERGRRDDHRRRYAAEYELGAEPPLHPNRCRGRGGGPCDDCREALADYLTIPACRRALRLKLGLPVDVPVPDDEFRRYVTHAEKFGVKKFRVTKFGVTKFEYVEETVAVELGWPEDRLVRLRVELDSIAARGPRWSRNKHKPVSAKELRQAVATLAAEGLPPVEIAAELDIGLERVERLRAGHRATTRRRRRSAAETAAAVAMLWAEKLTTTEIAGKLGVSPKRVQQVLADQRLLGGSEPGGITP